MAKCHGFCFALPYNLYIYLYSVGNISTAIQYIRLMPALESASNTDDNMRFSIVEVMKYKQAADKPDPKKLTTVNNWEQFGLMIIFKTFFEQI